MRRLPRAPVIGQRFSRDTETATAGLTIVAAPNKLNDFRANWSRQKAAALSGVDAFYGAVPPRASELFPPAYNTNDEVNFRFLSYDGEVDVANRPPNLQRQWNVVDTFSLTARAHQLKFGLDWRLLNFTDGNDNELSVLVTYPQMQAGVAGTIIQTGKESVSARTVNFSSFAQDTWKVLPALTLTYGLRWDITTAPVATTPGRPLFAVTGISDSQPFGLASPGTRLWSTRLNNLAPRLGAAWQMTPKTTLRGGYGLFYDLGYGGGVSEILSRFPYGNSTNLNLEPFYLNNPAFVPPPPISFAFSPARLYINAVDPHLRTPLTYEWNVTIERTLGSNQRLSASYVGAEGRNLLREDSISLVTSSNSYGPYVFLTTNGDWSRYSALQIQFQRPLTRGLQALVSYTLSKSTDTNSSDVCQCSYTNSLRTVNPAVDLGPSDFDQRNSFSGAVSYHAPAPRDRFYRDLLKDWTLDAIVRSSSALPFSISTTNTSPVFGTYYTRPDAVPGVPSYLPDANNPGGRQLNPAAFSTPPPGQYGDLPRNSFRGFPINQTDLALSRRFRLSERAAVDARVEYFNIFNHPMFYFPNNFFSSGQFGIVGSTFNNGNTTYGALNPLYQTGGPRSAQFTVKLTF
jgi:hypothetical protein